MGTQKRGTKFKADFTIPKKKVATDDYEPRNPLSNVYDEQSTSTGTFEQVKALTVQKTIVPFFVAGWRQKERPKIAKVRSNRPKYLQSDSTLPSELTELFQPLFCKLCECQHTSNIMAKLHYDSKKHEKKIRKFLTEYAEKTSTPLHPLAVAAKKEEDADPKHFYCDDCGVALTGKLHAESHYMSKNHRRVILGAARGRVSFGCGFAKELLLERLFCQLCNVPVTSEQQMTLHVNGSRHKKKKRTQEIEDAMKSLDDTILSSLGTNVVKTDLSVFRTPTGFYYCNPCNLTLNSEIQFKQHLESKKHKKKAANGV